MKKESFATSKRYRFKTKGLAKEIKFLKRLRARRARKNIDEWNKTYA